MKMRLDLMDTWRQRIAVIEEAPAVEAMQRGPDQPDLLRCTLPHVEGFGPGCAINVYVNDAPWRRYEVRRTQLSWDADFQPEHNTRTPVRDCMRVTAAADPESNRRMRRVYVDTSFEETFRDIISRTPGPLHYHVTHNAYPDGAQREYTKFCGRATADNALEYGGIGTGQWVDSARIDATAAWAKDGDTIGGLVVDGVPWPDVRLMMIDADETTLNNQARKQRPETALWTPERYAKSAYKLRADRATALLQALMDGKGISHIELNPHRDATGAFDDRVDAYGRYIGLVFGGGECFNAALVEHDVADVFLYAEGRYHVPEHRLKEFYSYTGPHTTSHPVIGPHVNALDLDCGAMEAIALLTYMTGDHVFSVSPEMSVSLREITGPDHCYRYRSDMMAVTSGFTDADMINWLGVSGNGVLAPERLTDSRGESIGAYGLRATGMDVEWIGHDEDKQRLVQGLLDDLAWPRPEIRVTFFGGAPELTVGDIVAVVGAPLARRARRVSGEWNDLFDPDTLTGRIVELRHGMRGERTWTEAALSAPLRSVRAPIATMRRIRSKGEPLFALRLDEPLAGLDQPVFHLP